MYYESLYEDAWDETEINNLEDAELRDIYAASGLEEMVLI